MKTVHFLGIGGSGMSAAAALAHDAGYGVTGCDLKVDSPYTQKLIQMEIPIWEGQSKNHLTDTDLLVVTPAVMFSAPLPEEVIIARDKGVVMTWQEFLGKEIQKNKKVVAIAGTHGKSTTTAMLSLILERAGKDPSVMIGATIKEWDTNFRSGKSNLFITESDEFYDNFLNYSPEIILLNNIEYDHPDYFKSMEQMYSSFRKHILSLKGEKILIVNRTSEGIERLLLSIPDDLLKEINILGYSEPHPDIQLSVLGNHNLMNATGAYIAAEALGVNKKIILESLKEFKGIGRRLELIGDRNGIKVYDDYAHHPTAIRETLKALRQKYPHATIKALVEPHSFSRTKALLLQYKEAFKDADEVVIGPIFKARDNETFGISSQTIVEVSDHANIHTGDSIKELHSGDVVIVMGAGDSYKWARDMANKI